jgi:DNA-binding transcriptional LysR family regulator
VDYFTAVKAFIQVVQAGSFVKAAQTLNLPRNTVTKHIQSLESHLRVKLLNRTTRRISLTNDGTAYYERMVRVVDQWLEAANLGFPVCGL